MSIDDLNRWREARQRRQIKRAQRGGARRERWRFAAWAGGIGALLLLQRFWGHVIDFLARVL